MELAYDPTMSSKIVKDLRKLVLEQASLPSPEELDLLRVPSLEAARQAEEKIAAAWDEEREEKKAIKESLREDLRGRADWHKYCRQELEEVAARREELIEQGKVDLRNAQSDLDRLKCKEPDRSGLKRRISDLHRKKAREGSDENGHHHAVLDPGKWSGDLEALYTWNRDCILHYFPKAGASPTDVLYGLNETKDIEFMPHLRVLSGMLLHLERSHGRAVFQKPLSQFRFLLAKLGIRSILEVGAGAYGPLLWLARTGIPQELEIEMKAIDLRPPEAARLKEWEDRNIPYRQGDAFEFLQSGKKYDLILSCGVLSPGGVSDYRALTEDQEQLPALEFLKEADSNCHKLARLMVDSLSDNPAAAVIAASWYGSLALKEQALEQFAAVRLWQHSDSARESDSMKIFGSHSALYITTSREGRAYRDWYRDNEELVDYGKSLLSGIKLAVFGKRDEGADE